jgi:hypothetical protein
MDDRHGTVSTIVLSLGHTIHVGPINWFHWEPFFLKNSITLGELRKSNCISLLKMKDLWDLED